MFFFVSLLSAGLLSAQNKERIRISGNIEVPTGFKAEGGSSIYNQTSGRGTVSSEGGNFIIKVAPGDSLNFCGPISKKMDSGR